MYNRFVKNWISTAIGIIIILASLVMLYMGKIDTNQFLLVAGFGAGIAAIKYKQNGN